MTFDIHTVLYKDPRSSQLTAFKTVLWSFCLVKLISKRRFISWTNCMLLYVDVPSNLLQSLTASFLFPPKIKYGAGRTTLSSVGSVAFLKASTRLHRNIVRDKISRDCCWFFSPWRTESISPFTQRLPASAGSPLGEILIKTSSARYLTPDTQ